MNTISCARGLQAAKFKNNDDDADDDDDHWRRSVVKSGGQGQPAQATKLFQITSYVNDFPTHNNPGSWQPVGASKN